MQSLNYFSAGGGTGGANVKTPSVVRLTGWGFKFSAFLNPNIFSGIANDLFQSSGL